jgi:hypothetical protein
LTQAFQPGTPPVPGRFIGNPPGELRPFLMSAAAPGHKPRFFSASVNSTYCLGLNLKVINSTDLRIILQENWKWKYNTVTMPFDHSTTYG